MREKYSEGVSVIIATLVLIVVAVIGAISVAYIMGAFSTNVSKQINPPQATTTGPGNQILITDSPLSRDIDQQLASQYMAGHRGVDIITKDCPDDEAAIMALNQNITDIAVLSQTPGPVLLFEYPNLQARIIGGRAIVIIANVNLNISSLSQSDLSNVYSNTKKSVPANLTGLTTAIRNNDGKGSEMIFAGWLTDGAASSLDDYMATPTGVSGYTASSESDVLAKVSSTPGAIGFIDWGYVANNNPSTSHIKVIPIINKNNLEVQTPDVNGIKNELVNMNNNYYDDGLISQLYYTTNANGQSGSPASDYINWARSSEGSSQMDILGMYGAVDLGIT